MFSTTQILPLEAPPSDGNLGPLPPYKSNQAPVDVATHTKTIGIIHPPPDIIRTIVEKTAVFVLKNGLEFEKRIMAENSKNAKFNFLDSSDPYHAFYQLRLSELSFNNQDGATEVWPLPPLPNLALNLPRPPPSVQYPCAPRPLGVPMMQPMLSMPGPPGHPSMMMMNRPPQMQPGMPGPPPPGSQFAHLQVPRPYGQPPLSSMGIMQPSPMP